MNNDNIGSNFLIAPSILSSDFAHLGKEVESVVAAGADWIHIDVMDGHFVPNITIGAPVVKSLKPITKAPLDVHLMIENPEKHIEDFVKAGADYLTIHVESTKYPDQVLKKIRELGCRPGITLKPATSVEEILPFLELVDLALVMTVNPGFSGQSFMSDQLSKVPIIRERLRQINHQAYIQIDGGVNAETASQCLEADVLVAGSYVFNNCEGDYSQAIKNIKDKK